MVTKSKGNRWREQEWRWRNLRSATHIAAADGPGWIYCGELGYEGLYKLGLTTNASARQKALQAANTRYRNLWCVQVGHRVTAERIVHLALREWRIDRELFKLSAFQVGALQDRLRDTMHIKVPKELYPSPAQLKASVATEKEL